MATDGQPGPITVLVAGGQPAVRAAFAEALDEHGFSVVAEAGDVPSALVAAEVARPDLMLVDLELPGGGLAAVAQVAARVPETTIIALAGSVDVGEMLSALERGASGYLPKEIGAEE